jgi:hypothetical protein
MPVLTRRARLLALATLLAFAAGILVAALLRPGAPPSLDQPATLPSPPANAEVVLAVGDIGSCSSEADEAVATLASRLPGRIAVLGDIAYPEGSTRDFEACFESAWGPMRSRMHPTPGNHEYDQPEAAPYFSWFGDAAGEPGQGWYSFDLGAWHIVSLNSNCSMVEGCRAGSPQLEWLEEDLRAHPADCLLAFWHHPRYSSGRHGTSAQTEALWAALLRAGMDVALAGHDHSYERIRAGGPRQFVVGTGGRSLYRFDDDPLPSTETRHDGSYGLLWLALGEGTYEWQFVPLGLTLFSDSGTGDCG